MLSIIFFMACSTGPTVIAVDPGTVNPGQMISVMGESFDPKAEVFLQLNAEAPATATSSTAFKGEVLLEAVVPAGMSPGTYSVGVRQEGAVSLLANALIIEAIKADTPCARAYTANTQVSLARKEVVVDRFHPEGERETLRIPIKEITGIEYELQKAEDGTLCSVIFMRTGETKRIIFDDDNKVDLKERAYKLGQSMGKKVKITREDAEALVVKEEAPK